MKDTADIEKSSPKQQKNKKPKKISLDYLTNAGKFYLEKFPASSSHFRQVMLRKIRKSCQAHPDQSPETCLELLETVITDFTRLGFLNDQAYANGLIYSLLQRGWSQRKIDYSLAVKGLTAEVIDAAIKYNVPDDADIELRSALRWMQKKRLGCFAQKPEQPEKSLASLGRAGYDFETARKALQTPLETAEELLSKLG